MMRRPKDRFTARENWFDVERLQFVTFRQHESTKIRTRNARLENAGPKNAGTKNER